MLATTHVLVGAGAGVLVHDALMAFLLSIMLHLLIDKLPHYWPPAQKSKTILTLVDWSIAVLILSLLIVYPIPNQASTVAGAFGGLLVDLLLIGVPFLRKSRVGQWHTNRQPHKAKISFMATDLIFIVPIAICLLVEATSR